MDTVIDCPCLDRELERPCARCSYDHHSGECEQCDGDSVVTVSPLAHEGGRR